MTTSDDGHLTHAAAAYRELGWCRSPYRFASGAVELLRTSIESICRQRRPEVVYEKPGGPVRAVHGCHAFDEVCAALVRQPCLLALARALTGRPVYVYQFKVNLKQAREGAAWPWHQDFTFWSREDGMRRPDAVNIAISLDEIHSGNGPLVVIPGTHRLGIVGEPVGGPPRGGDWRSHVSADLAHVVDADVAAGLARTNGTTLLTGSAGAVQAFHPSIVHSSSDNESPDRRALLLITYNSVDNAPLRPTRPEFLVSRDATGLEPAADERFTLEAG